jgi:hypothetical protein
MRRASQKELEQIIREDSTMRLTNPFTEHPQRQGVTYFEHWCFAMGIAARLLRSVAAFALHALLPCAPIARRLDLEATAAYLYERNRWIESANRSKQRKARPTFAQATVS